jgi:hypothetical protein
MNFEEWFNKTYPNYQNSKALKLEIIRKMMTVQVSVLHSIALAFTQKL